MSNKVNSLTDRESEEDTLTEERVKIPRRFLVIIHNDDFTTQEFVVYVLERFFSKKREEAVALMLKVHKHGKAVAGIYSRDIAESKVQQVNQYARDQQFPLRLTCEAE